MQDLSFKVLFTSHGMVYKVHNVIYIYYNSVNTSHKLGNTYTTIQRY